MLNVGISGITGRMGGAVVNALSMSNDSEMRLSAAIHRPGSDHLNKDVGLFVSGHRQGNHFGVPIVASVRDADFDVLIDFSLPDSCIENAQYCASLGKAIAIGVTGFNANQMNELETLSNHAPVVLAPNMSVGVNLLFHMLKQASAVYAEAADIEIVETHHKDKIDAPSGTALKMGEVIAQAQGKNLADCAVYNRNDLREARKPGSIGFASLRAGDVIGEHTVLFAAENERLEISHKATDRMTFANGALRAAKWLSGQKPGLYSMQDVLGLVE